MDKILASALTVRKLIELLKTIPQDAPVGCIGHFGEFYPMNKHNFYYSVKRECYVTPNNNWRSDDRVYINPLEIECPDIGEVPD